jgi:uncharacterized protein (TIGR02001 family)
VPALWVPAVGHAQALSIAAGFAATSEYVADGIPQSNGFAFQPYVELGYSGFYAGIWASNVSSAVLGTADTLEYDLYAGYRAEVGRFSYDLGYTHYFYNRTGACCGDFALSMGVAATDTLEFGAKIKLNPATSVTNLSGSVAFAPVDKVTLAAGYGTISGAHTYWSVGGSYAVNDMVSLDLTYHDTSITRGLVVGTVSVDFNLR